MEINVYKLWTLNWYSNWLTSQLSLHVGFIFCQNNYKADKVVNAKNSYVVIIHVIINDNCIMLHKLAVKW